MYRYNIQLIFTITKCVGTLVHVKLSKLSDFHVRLPWIFSLMFPEWKTHIYLVPVHFQSFYAKTVQSALSKTIINLNGYESSSGTEPFSTYRYITLVYIWWFLSRNPFFSPLNVIHVLLYYTRTYSYGPYQKLME